MRANSVVRTTSADGPIVRAVPVGAWRSPVSALVWGTRGRGFKSRRPDQTHPMTRCDLHRGDAPLLSSRIARERQPRLKFLRGFPHRLRIRAPLPFVFSAAPTIAGAAATAAVCIVINGLFMRADGFGRTT